MASRLSRDPEAERPRPWYADGLRFQCRPDCSACCSDHDDYTYLYLQDGDVERLARYLGWESERFRRRYTTLDDGRPVLAIHGSDCPFLLRGRCAVYPVRPVQCRTFPFWRETLRSPDEWESLSVFCPGINAGERHDLKVIERALEARRPCGADQARESP